MGNAFAVFKPNIRGVPKRTLRFGLHGWLDIKSNQQIHYRWPWRRTWIEMLDREPDLQPIVSRSGQVMLVRQNPSGSPKSIKFKSFATILVLLFGTLFALGLSHLDFRPSELTSRSETSIGQNQNLNVTSPLICDQLLANPEDLFDSWLAGTTVKGLEISELNQQQLGGMQSRVVNVVCNLTQQKFQVLLSIHNKVWELKKVTRLEN